MKKALVRLLIALLLITVPLSTIANADSTIYTEGNLYYIIEDGSITIVGCFGDDEVITVPASIAGIPVNSIAPGAFANSNAKVINLPDTIMEVQNGATGNANVVFDSNTDNPKDFSDIASTYEEIAQQEDNTHTWHDEGNADFEESLPENSEESNTDSASENTETQPETESAEIENNGNDTGNGVTNTDTEQGNAEEQPQPEENSNTVIWIVAVVAVAAICLIAIISRKKKNK